MQSCITYRNINHLQGFVGFQGEIQNKMSGFMSTNLEIHGHLTTKYISWLTSFEHMSMFKSKTRKYLIDDTLMDMGGKSNIVAK